jgi:molybdopterin synthase sulfur carrier subunit
MSATMIRVELPAHLRMLAKAPCEVLVAVRETTLRGVMVALEAAYPMLRGTIRDYGTGERRAMLRFFAEQEDMSHLGIDAALPASVVEGREAWLIVGAIAGG